MNAARALWVVGAGRAELRPETLPEPGDGEVRIRASWSAISRGTERLVLDGRVPADSADRMRCPHQAGSFPWPVKYGYCSVGAVEAGALPVGTRVFCLYPHQDRYVVPVGAVVPVPDAVPSERAALAANAETALNAVWDGAVGPGDRVTVVGAGVVGCLVARVCARIPGTRVHLVDTLASRDEVARTLGAVFLSPDDVLAGTSDVVFHASASGAGLATALRAAGAEATVVELSWYGDAGVQAPLGGSFHHDRLTVRSSQVGRLPPGRAPRWTYRRRLEAALGLLDDPALDVLLDPPIPFADAPAGLAAAVARPATLCARFAYLS